jgi:hypothetical protein
VRPGADIVLVFPPSLQRGQQQQAQSDMVQLQGRFAALPAQRLMAALAFVCRSEGPIRGAASGASLVAAPVACWTLPLPAPRPDEDPMRVAAANLFEGAAAGASPARAATLIGTRASTVSTAAGPDGGSAQRREAAGVAHLVREVEADARRQTLRAREVSTGSTASTSSSAASPPPDYNYSRGLPLPRLPPESESSLSSSPSAVESDRGARSTSAVHGHTSYGVAWALNSVPASGAPAPSYSLARKALAAVAAGPPAPSYTPQRVAYPRRAFWQVTPLTVRARDMEKAGVTTLGTTELSPGAAFLLCCIFPRIVFRIFH